MDCNRGDYGYGEDGCRDARPAVYLQRATCQLCWIQKHSQKHCSGPMPPWVNFSSWRWMTLLLINLYIMFSSQFFRESAVQILIEFMLYRTQFGTPLLQMHVWKLKAASSMYFLQLPEPSYLLFRALYIWALTSFSLTSSLSQFTPHLSPLDRREDGISLREASGEIAT